MRRRSLAILAVLLMLPAGAALAKGKPVKTVKATVTVRNASGVVVKGWTLRVGLAKGTRLARAKGLKASGRKGAVVLTPKTGAKLADGAKRTLRIVVKGAKAPRSFKVAGRPCAQTKGKRHGATVRVAVFCTLEGSPTPDPASTPGPDPTATAAPTATASPSPTASPGASTTPYPVAP